MKKIVKKQLKEDEFVTTLNKLIVFAKKRTREILIGVAAIVFAFFLYSGLRFLQAQSLKKESRILGEAIQLRSELNTDPAKVARLEELAGSGKFSRLASVLLATHWVEKGDLEKALASLEKVGDEPKDFVFYQARDLEAQVFVLQKKYDQALSIYTAIEEEKPKGYPLDAILFHKAQVLEEKGDRAEALDVYKKLQTDFPQSFYGYEASLKVTRLGSKG